MNTVDAVQMMTRVPPPAPMAQRTLFMCSTSDTGKQTQNGGQT